MTDRRQPQLRDRLALGLVPVAGLSLVPAWLATSWTFVLFGLLVLAVLWGIRHYELSRAQLRSRLEIERLEAEKLRELDRARSRFFADVSHEFRTPLTLTLGPLDDLLDGLHGPLDDSAREQVELARRSAARVLDLINQIMELARLEARRIPLKAQRLDLTALVDQATEPFLALAERRTIRLETALPPGPVPIEADPEQMEKVVANLLSNALKFTPKGGMVRVSVHDDDTTARITVRDSGPGIPEEEQSRVFDRFYRSERPATPQSGTGIGLALAKEVVELHDGRVWVESEEGFGATFIVELPRAGAEPANPAGPGRAMTDQP